MKGVDQAQRRKEKHNFIPDLESFLKNKEKITTMYGHVS